MRARNMQALTDAIKKRHPGVVIYGIGDAAHKLRSSDHNEDDTAGSKAAQSDADSNPEHRAIDVMIGPAFSNAQAYELIADLLADPAARARLFYILFNGWRWSRSTNWARVPFDGDPHDDHIHASGWAADDENAAGWPAVDGTGEDTMAIEWADVLGGVAYAKRTLRQAVQDLSNLRDGLVAPPGAAFGSKPYFDPGSVVDVLVKGALAVPTLVSRVAGLEEAVSKLSTPPPVQVDTAPIAAALRADLEAMVDAAVDRGVRRSLGSLDGATPDGQG